MQFDGARTLVILVGPKGSGKSHLGRLMQALDLLTFVEVEPIVMDALELCRREGVAYGRHGFDAIEHALAEQFRAHDVLGIELTGASPHCESFLARMRESARVVLVRIDAPDALCWSRMAARDASAQIPTSDILTSRINAASRALAWAWDAHVVNDESDPAATEAAVRSLSRRWSA